MSAEDSNLAAADQRKEKYHEDSKITGVRHKRPHVIRSLISTYPNSASLLSSLKQATITRTNDKEGQNEITSKSSSAYTPKVFQFTDLKARSSHKKI